MATIGEERGKTCVEPTGFLDNPIRKPDQYCGCDTVRQPAMYTEQQVNISEDANCRKAQNATTYTSPRDV